MFRNTFITTGVVIAAVFTLYSSPQKAVEVNTGGPFIANSPHPSLQFKESNYTGNQSTKDLKSSDRDEAISMVESVNTPIIYDALNRAKAIDDEEAERLQKKYATFLGVKPETITNIKLYRFIDEWLNTPYLWGGETKKGIDCSAFVQRLLKDVYNINIKINRTAIDQFFSNWIERFAYTTKIAEGDLVFFKTIRGRAITHVGFYCANRRFINSSSRSGVSFGNLDDPYWKKKFVTAGRIKLSKLKVSSN